MDENPTGIQPLYGYPEVKKVMKVDVTDDPVIAILKPSIGKKVEDSDWANQWWRQGQDSVTDENEEPEFVSVGDGKKKCSKRSVLPSEGRRPSAIQWDEDDDYPLLSPSLQVTGQLSDGKSVEPTEYHQILAHVTRIELNKDTTLCGQVSRLILPDDGELTTDTNTGSSLPTPPIACLKVHSPFARYRCKACGDGQSDEWQVSKLLSGKGGFGNVYQTHHLGMRLAIKEFNECGHTKGGACCANCAESRQSEISTLMELQHPNIVIIMGHCDGHHEFLMEFMRGGNIADLVAKEELPTDLILSYTIQVTLGLQYIHEKGYLHRDLKGRNLLLDETRNTVKIADFGLTIQLPAGETEVTDKGAPGTPVFMAPETMMRKFSKASDVWSLGCCMLEMATGKPPWNPWNFENDCQAIFKIGSAKEPPDIPDDVNPELKNVMEWCLQIERDKRPTAWELSQSLQDVYLGPYPLCGTSNENRRYLDSALMCGKN